MSPIFFALAFLAALLGLEGLYHLIRGRRGVTRDRTRERLKALIANAAQAEVDSASMVRQMREKSHFAVLDSLKRLLFRAGSSLTLGRFVGLSLALGTMGFSAAYVAFGDPVRSGMGMLAGIIPLISARRAAKRRMSDFADQTPEGLELLTRALRAGHALSTGFQLVGEELEDPIGTEFGLVAEELRLGLDLREALENLVKRVDNDDMPYFATAVLIQRQTGGNLAELLDKLSSLLRERGEFYGKVRALTAQGRGAATFLALWVPFITTVVHLTAPDYLTPLFENTWGHGVLAAVGALTLSGYFIARRIADVEA